VPDHDKIFCGFSHSGTLTLSPERQLASERRYRTETVSVDKNISEKQRRVSTFSLSDTFSYESTDQNFLALQISNVLSIWLP